MSTTYRLLSPEQLRELDSSGHYPGAQVEIEGVVSCASQAEIERRSDFNIHMFRFAAWRFRGQAIRQSKLALFRPVVPRQGWDEFTEFSVHRATVLISDDEARAIVVDHTEIRPPVDREFINVIEGLQQPIVVVNEFCGEMSFDRSLDRFEGQAVWNRRTIATYLPCDDSRPSDSQLDTAAHLFREQQEWNERTRAFAAEHLLAMKNDSWLEENEQPLSFDDFAARLMLQSLTIYEDGYFSFWYDDDDMFLGHGVVVAGTLENGPDDAGIHG